MILLAGSLFVIPSKRYLLRDSWHSHDYWLKAEDGKKKSREVTAGGPPAKLYGSGLILAVTRDNHAPLGIGGSRWRKPMLK